MNMKILQEDQADKKQYTGGIYTDSAPHTNNDERLEKIGKYQHSLTLYIQLNSSDWLHMPQANTIKKREWLSNFLGHAINSSHLSNS